MQGTVGEALSLGVDAGEVVAGRTGDEHNVVWQGVLFPTAPQGKCMQVRTYVCAHWGPHLPRP